MSVFIHPNCYVGVSLPVTDPFSKSLLYIQTFIAGKFESSYRKVIDIDLGLSPRRVAEQTNVTNLVHHQQHQQTPLELPVATISNGYRTLRCRLRHSPQSCGHNPPQAPRHPRVGSQERRQTPSPGTKRRVVVPRSPHQNRQRRMGSRTTHSHTTSTRHLHSLQTLLRLVRKERDCFR